MTREGSRRARSLRAELLAVARREGEEFQALLTRYATERLVHRLAGSEWGDRLILKGAWLFEAWEIPRRSTQDVDFLAEGDSTPKAVAGAFREIIAQPVEDDGLFFGSDGIRVLETREGAGYPGVRVRIPGDLAGARFVVQVDLGFGDALVEDPIRIELPTLLDLPAPEVLAYSVEVAIAEKIEAIVRWGGANSRYKDFYDIAILAKERVIDGVRLRAQVMATLDRRGTEVPDSLPVGLQDSFARPDREEQWKAFQTRSEATETFSLPEAIALLRELLWPVLKAIGGDKAFTYKWEPALARWIVDS